jgi:hypothetical protein
MEEKSEKLLTCIATCEVCGQEIGRAEHVPERQKSIVMMSAPLNCFCPIEEHNTYSDCNIGVQLEWKEEASNEAALALKG